MSFIGVSGSDLYGPQKIENKLFCQDVTSYIRQQIIEDLPSNLKNAILAQDINLQNGEEIMSTLEISLASIIRQTSVVQSAKNFLSAGPLNSFVYLKEKLEKGRKG